MISLAPWVTPRNSIALALLNILSISLMSIRTLLLLIVTGTLEAQAAGNPFELRPRLDVSTADTSAAAPSDGNPFELKRPGYQPATIDSAEAATPDNPFDIALPNTAVTEELPPPADTDAAPEGENAVIEAPLLLLVLLIVGALTLCLIFFRSTYRKAYRALFNDKLLSQLYREREVGAFGVFFILYSLFFLAGGLFLLLTLRHWGVWSGTGGWWRWYAYAVAGLAALLLLKHLVLALIGYVFPVQREISRYSFTIMLFGIVMGFCLVPLTTMLALVPEELRTAVILSGLGIVAILYLIRLLHSLLIAGGFIFNYFFHFLSYICAVEIGPALCLYKMIADF